MNRIFLVAWTLVVTCPVSFGQTHSTAAAAEPIPCLTLKLPREREQNAPALSLVANDNSNVSCPLRLAPFQEQLFSPSKFKWQELPARAENLRDPAPRVTGALLNQMSFEANPAQIALFDRVEREGLLKLPGPKYDNDLERHLAGAFQPKIIHWGHAEIESPIITAIARKNPLCLLNRMILNISF
jgi:hypothetical protein